jgi:hypothetical protein
MLALRRSNAPALEPRLFFLHGPSRGGSGSGF